MPIGCSIPAILVRGMVAVPKELLADVEEERRRLTVKNVAKLASEKAGFLRRNQPDQYIMYREDESYFYVPRNWLARLKPDLIKNKDYRVLYALGAELRYTADPRPPVANVQLGTDLVHLGPNEQQPFDQRPAFDALVAPARFPYGKILALRCGGGKTAVSLKGAHHRRGRTLWVTINTLLLEQAKGDIQQWLGLPPSAIGHVQAEKHDWRGRDIAVAMLHSLARKTYEQEFWDYWDLVIFDEGDVLAAHEFNPVVQQFRAERWLLTATPKRDDGLDPLFERHIGPSCYTHLEYDLRPDCYFYSTAVDSSVLAYAGWDALRGQRRVCYPIVARNLLFNDQRNQGLFQLIRKATDKSRTCLVLGDSVEGLAYACKQARKTLPHLSHGLIVGRVPQKARTAIVQENTVVWATTTLAYRGLDRPAFDTLIMATLVRAKKAVCRQAVGRVLRAQKDKRPPLVIVMSDKMVEPLAGLAAKMVRIFRAEKWRVNNADDLINMQRDRNRADQEDRLHGYTTRKR